VFYGTIAYRDKEVVSDNFVRFHAPLHPCTTALPSGRETLIKQVDAL
jgi:hypothetical protein